MASLRQFQCNGAHVVQPYNMNTVCDMLKKNLARCSLFMPKKLHLKNRVLLHLSTRHKGHYTFSTLSLCIFHPRCYRVSPFLPVSLFISPSLVHCFSLSRREVQNSGNGKGRLLLECTPLPTFARVLAKDG